VEAKPFSPEDLVMFAFREVQCDDTMRQFIQVLRFDIGDVLGQPLRAQLLLDRRHKQNKGQSAPVAYFRMSSPDQVIKLGNTGLAVSAVLAFAQQGQLEPGYDEVKAAVRTLLRLFVEADVCSAVEVMLRDVRLHRMALVRGPPEMHHRMPDGKLVEVP
jgi:hypothetical protein